MLQRSPGAFNKGFVIWLARTYFKELNPGEQIPSDYEDQIDGTLTCQENLSILEREYPTFRWKKANKRQLEEVEREELEKIEAQAKSYYSSRPLSRRSSKRKITRRSRNSSRK
jgi:hypothetical protein